MGQAWKFLPILDFIGSMLGFYRLSTQVVLHPPDVLRFACSDTSGVLLQEGEHGSARHVAKKCAVERHENHISCLDTRVTNEPYLSEYQA